MPTNDQSIRQELLAFLKGGLAHATLDDAIKDFPAALYAKKPSSAPHNAWQQLEHIRLTLHDLLDFCTNRDYRALEWPEGYWPRDDSPPSPEAWGASVKALRKDLSAFEKMLKNPEVDLYAKIPWGDGQTILREILLAIDHTGYHLGQLVMLRKQLGAWKS
ncbi:MAG: DinB family protein [Acidobacteriaceae bacterium]